MPNLLDTIAELEAAIERLTTQRELLGADAVALAIEPLRARLAELRATQRPEAPAPPEAERKLVTVMFADISGFTQMSEARDPEDVRRLVNACFDYLVPVIQKYEGTIEKFIGDSIMAIFGAPVAHENDPERALRAALELMDALGAFNDRQQTDLGLHIGVNSGLVVAGGIGSQGRQQYGVMGDAVNVAARLEDASERGQILVGHDTFRLTAGLFEFATMAPLRVKGKQKPLAVHQLLRAKSRGVPRTHGGLQAQLIGRERELTAIAESIEALAEGRGQIVCVIGEAGLGKSRLAEEARALALHMRQPGTDTRGLRWLEGRALSYGGAMTYWTLTQLIRSDLGLADGDVEDALAALSARLSHLFEGGAGEVMPFIANLVGIRLAEPLAAPVHRLDSEALQQQTLAAVAAYIERLAAAQPTVLVFEDLHWADPSTLAAVASLLPLTDRMPLMVMALMRPEREHGCWRIKQTAEAEYAHRYTELLLKPLSAADAQNLLTCLLDMAELPEFIQRIVVERSDGNPFFVEELTNSLIEQGVIALDGGRWGAVSDAVNIAVPETVQGVLLARIDRLPDDVRRTLQLASVIGRSFLVRILKEVSSAGADFEAHLLHLQRADLVREKSRRPEREYIFKHPLTQEAAYQSLLLERRRDYHRRVGEAIERLFPQQQEEFYGILAHHFGAAREREKAVAYARLAASRAAGLHAYPEAVEYLEQALRHLPDDAPALRLAVLEQLADVHRRFGDRARAVPLYQSAARLWAQLPGGAPTDGIRLQRKVGQTVSALNWLAERRRYAPAALSALEMANALAEGEPPHADIVRLLTARAHYALRMHAPPDVDSAERFAHAAVEMAQRLDEPVELAAALEAVVITMGLRQGYRERVPLALRRLELSRDPRFGDAYERAGILHQAGAALAEVGEFRSALPYLEEAEGLAEQLQAAEKLVSVMEDQAICWLRLDRWDEVLNVEDKRRALEQRFPNFRERVGRMCYNIAISACVHALRGEDARAEALRSESYQIMLEAFGAPEGWHRGQRY